jgi:transcriptional regulator with XRE-family HTH domain
MKTKPTTFHDMLIAADPELAAMVEEARQNIRIAEQIYSLRHRRKLTQKQLAERVGTRQSVIARLEDSDYESYTLDTLRRVAAALGAVLRVEMVPAEDAEGRAKSVKRRPARKAARRARPASA